MDDNDDIKINVENDDVFNKYKPTTSLPEVTSEDDNLSPYPTRPSRPTKPTVRWPTYHATSSHGTSLQYGATSSMYEETSTTMTTTKPTEISQRNSYVHFPVTRPTKKPPPPPDSPSAKTTSRPVWSWEDRRSTKTTPPFEQEVISTTTSSTTTVTTTTTTTTTKPYFPSSETNVIAGGNVQWTKKGRPTRPTRPPKPSTFDLVTYFPPLNVDQPLEDEEDESTILRTPPQTTSSTTTTTFKSTTTTSAPTTTTTTTTIAIMQTPRSPVHIMPPPRLSTTLATPPPLPSSPSAEPRGGCGVPVLNKSCPKGRIVNGTQSCYGQFPWQVNYRYEILLKRKYLKSIK
jgi:hypothetical protein